MRASTIATVFGGGIVTVLAATLYMRQQAELTRQSGDVRALQRQLAVMTESPEAPLTRAPLPTSPVATAMGATYVAPQALPPSPLGVQAPGASSSPQRRAAEAREHLQTAFDMDHAASRATLDALRGARQKLNEVLPPGAEVASFDCRATMCRLEATQIPAESLHGFERTALDLNEPTKIMDVHEIFVSHVKDPRDPGMDTVIAYMSTEGGRLPSMR